jgi:dipeptidyl aminopeptidase/acylaminoacyl peptidase
MTHDLRGTDTWNAVERHFRRIHEPAFGSPHRLIEPSVSADGSAVAVTGFVYDELEGLARRRAYVVAEGGVTEVDAGGSSSASARLSPDGTRLAVLTDAGDEGVFQLVVTGADGGGERWVAPEVPGTVEYLDWAPDGSAVLLGVAGRGADLSGGQGSGTTKAVDADVPAWFPTVDDGAAADAWRSTWVFDLATRDLRRWSPESVNVWESTWLGTDAVLAVVSEAPQEGAWYTATLVRIDRAGALTTIHRPEVQLGWPAASPSGARVAVVEAVCSDRWVVAGDLLVGGTDGLRRVDTLGVDVTGTRWIDEDHLGIVGIRGLETVVAVHDVHTGMTAERWASTETSCGFRYPEAAWTRSGDAVIVEEGYAQPHRVVLLPADGGEPRVLHALGDAGTDYLREVSGTAQPVSWDAPDGRRIEGLLCTPPGEGPFPLIVNIHGGPVWAFRNTWSMFYATTPLFVSRGYAVLNPNPRGSSGRGQEFAREVFGEMGGADTWDFTSGVDAMVARGIADPERIGLTGGSYGGYMASWLTTQDRRWAASVPISPVTDWYSQHFTSNIPFFDQLFLDADPEVPGNKAHRRSPVFQASSVRTPCLNIAGALDRCTPPGQALEFHQALLDHGVESSLAIYPQEGHGVRAFPAYIDFATRVLGWFERHMPA